MARILAVGNATVDIINIVDGYPAEDDEVRALFQQHSRGGNATNTLVVLSLLGHDCGWAGTIADEPDALFIIDDLQNHDINTSAVERVAGGKVPTSYVTLNRKNGSRTIVHYRDLPEYTYQAFTKIDLSAFDWVHFEGRNVSEIEKMAEYLHRHHPDLPCSLEIEKPRNGIERLFGYLSVLLYSKDYARSMGFSQAEPFLRHMAAQVLNADLVCSWGEAGASAIDREGNFITVAAFPPSKLVDTLGAGDTFNAGIIHNLLKGYSLAVALEEASRLAGKKCGFYGFDELAD